MSRATWVLMLAFAAGCIQHSLKPCADGTTCELGEACAPQGGCTTQAQIDACVSLAEGAACSVMNDDDTRAGMCTAAVCVLAGVCGDGRLDLGELCDDGNLRDGDTCSSMCRLATTCGDGIVDPSEVCDLGALNSSAPDAACRPDCLPHRCGDTIVDSDEQCDDGNNASGDDCHAMCTTPRCGDFTLDLAFGEVCDDGNTSDGDDCSADCRTGPITCGNGIPEGNLMESCDDGNLINGDGCQASCSLPRCSDHIVDIGELCDDGNTIPFDGCNQYCVPD